jgi:hypothetical protein
MTSPWPTAPWFRRARSVTLDVMAALRDDPAVNRVRVLSPLTDDERARHLGGELRRVAGDRQVDRARRGGRRHRRPVDRRARHPAHHADVPHRWCGRCLGRHHRWSAARRRALRGPQSPQQGDPRPHLRRGPHRRGRGQGPPGHHRRRRRRGDIYSVPRPEPPLEVKDGQEVRPATRSSKVPAIRRNSWRSRASARRSSTSSTRSRRCTATRVCRSTTSTSS